MSILVLGTVALDTVKTPFGRRKNMLGGSAVHFALSARLFNQVNLVAIIGEDFPKKHLEFLKEKGLVLTALTQEKGRTFRWEGEYKGDLNTAFTRNTELGVLSIFRPQLHEKQKKINYVFLANVDPHIQRHLLDNMHAPKLVALDSMNYWIEHKRPALLDLLKRVDIFVVNEHEARQLSGEYNLLKAAKYLRKRGPQMVLIKKGEHGVLFYADKFIFSLPAYPTEKVIDPTGAGDTFAGGFMGYLSRVKRMDSCAIKKAIAYGTVLASFNVEGFGPSKTSQLTLAQVKKRLKKFERIISLN